MQRRARVLHYIPGANTPYAFYYIVGSHAPATIRIESAVCEVFNVSTGHKTCPWMRTTPNSTQQNDTLFHIAHPHTVHMCRTVSYTAEAHINMASRDATHESNRRDEVDRNSERSLEMDRIKEKYRQLCLAEIIALDSLINISLAVIVHFFSAPFVRV